MKQDSEETVLSFLKLIGFPGIRRGETDEGVCNYLKSNNYNLTPDLVAGPPEIKEAPIEGLFFIDVIQPTSDLLFKSEFYKEHEIDVPREFKEILLTNSKERSFTYIDMLPTSHHNCYLRALNKKLNKYAHQRKFNRDGECLVSANFGLVYHFNLGVLEEGSVSDVKKLITLIDYIRFYKTLTPFENIDLKNAENLLLQELMNDKQDQPYLLSIGREWNNVPCLFYMLHISIIKQYMRHHLALISLNTVLFDNSDGNYPIHKWFVDRVFHPKSKKYLNDEYKENKVIINIGAGEELFS